MFETYLVAASIMETSEPQAEGMEATAPVSQEQQKQGINFIKRKPQANSERTNLP